jgi:quercetin dioxygenase-like cupin family protein
LLLADGETDELRVGDVVRTPADATHGLANAGDKEFAYLSVTTPLQDFTPACKDPKPPN